MKVKLRNLTLEQYEKWLYKKCNANNCDNCIFNVVHCCADKGCWVNHKEVYSNMFLDQEFEVEEERILTEEEHEYLSNIIKPFRDRIEYIEKYESTIGHQFLGVFSDSYKLFICKFCLFSKEEYKGLELYKRYTLEELGL